LHDSPFKITWLILRSDRRSATSITSAQ
jgi:hypothetical protein